MDYLKLNKLPDGSYTIIDTDNTKLFVLANLLLSKKIRSQIKSKLTDFPELAIGETLKFNFLPEYDFEIKRDNEEQLIIVMFKKYESKLEEDNPLIIDMYSTVLTDLIENFEDLTEDNSPTIYLVMEGDKVTAQTMLPPEQQKT